MLSDMSNVRNIAKKRRLGPKRAPERKGKTMAVVTTFFGVTRLSGADSDKFRRQVTYGRPSKAAKDALVRGTKMLEKMERTGTYVVKIKKK